MVYEDRLSECIKITFCKQWATSLSRTANSKKDILNHMPKMLKLFSGGGRWHVI